MPSSETGTGNVLRHDGPALPNNLETFVDTTSEAYKTAGWLLEKYDSVLREIVDHMNTHADVEYTTGDVVQVITDDAARDHYHDEIFSGAKENSELTQISDAQFEPVARRLIDTVHSQ